MALGIRRFRKSVHLRPAGRQSLPLQRRRSKEMAIAAVLNVPNPHEAPLYDLVTCESA